MITNDQIGMMFNSAQKGDLEYKLAIYKIFIDCSMSLKVEHK